MKDETRIWISYADENLDVAVLALDHGHLNACLQNAQQAEFNIGREYKIAGFSSVLLRLRRLCKPPHWSRRAEI